MKKRIAILLTACCFALAACGQSSQEEAPAETAEEETAEEEPEEEAEAADEAEEVVEEEEDSIPIVDETVEEAGIDAFVSFDNYKSMELEKEVTTVTDDDVDNEIQMMLESAPIPYPDGTKIENGMVANIDFAGTIDGVAFDGGTSQGYDLTIGSGSFIDDFEDQIVGHVKGDEFDVNVTFPEDYYSDDLAGKDAVFAVKINDVLEVLSEPTDEWVASNTEYQNVDEYKAATRAQLEEEAKANDDSYFQSDVMQAMVEEAQILKYPKDRYEYYYNQQVDSLKQYAEEVGTEYNDEFLAQVGYTEKDLEKVAKNYLAYDLISRYVLEKEGIDENSEKFNEKMQELLEMSGFSSKEEAMELGITEENIIRTTNNYLAVDVVIENAKVTEVEAGDMSVSE